MPSAAATKHRSSRATAAAPARSAKPATSKPASSRRPKVAKRGAAKPSFAKASPRNGSASGRSLSELGRELNAKVAEGRDAKEAANLERARAAAAKGEVFVYSPDLELDELSPIERRFIEGKSRSPADAQRGLRKLAERSLDTKTYPQGIAFIGAPDEDDA